MNTIRCKGCGKQVSFVKDRDSGKIQILDAVAPVYEIPLEDESVCIRRMGFFVSHFSTCAKANDFSKNKKVAA